MDLDAKLAEWRTLSTTLKEIKAKEMALRKEICADIFKGKIGKEKFNTYTFEVVAEQKVAYKLDKEVLTQMWGELTEQEKAAIKWTPDLKLREYKKLDNECLLNETITTKPSAPTLKVTLKLED